MQHLSKYTSWILYALMLFALFAFAMFYFGGDVPGTEDSEFVEPIYTGLVLNTAFVYVIAGVILTFCFAVFQFGSSLVTNPKEALTSVLMLGLFAALLIISWVCGSGEPLNLPAYDGADNVYFWLKLTDMWLYSSGFLLFAAILSICGFSLYKVIRN